MRHRTFARTYSRSLSKTNVLTKPLRKSKEPLVSKYVLVARTL
jgi:hypothetical protein